MTEDLAGTSLRPRSPPVYDDAVPSLGGYELESPVARGGMAEIWRARDRRSGDPVAIKRAADRWRVMVHSGLG